MKTYEWMASVSSIDDPLKIGELVQNQKIDLFYRLSALTANVYREDLKESARDYYRDLVHNPLEATAFEDYIDFTIWPIWKLIESEMKVNIGHLLKLKLPVFMIQFHFKLAHPLLSRDDSVAYPIDNPMRKEHVFKLPTISSTSWKGLFRNVVLVDVWQKLIESDLTEKILSDLADELICLTHLTGNLREKKVQNPDYDRERRWNRLIEVFEKKLKTDFKIADPDSFNYAGGLSFYPTFFKKLDLEIINPHDRVRRVGTKPILFEAVPKGEIGLFRLLYIQMPFWTPQTDDSKKVAIDMAKNDLKQVCTVLTKLFYEMGISAKRSSGYGTVEPTLPAIDGFSGELFSNFNEQPVITNAPVFKFSNLKQLVDFSKGGTAQ